MKRVFQKLSIHVDDAGGAVLPEFTVTLPLMLAVIGLAIDIFQVSYSKHAMQFVANSAVTEGVLFVEGWDNEDYASNVTDKAEGLTEKLWLSGAHANSTIVPRNQLGTWVRLDMERPVELNSFSRLLLLLPENKFDIRIFSEGRLESS